MDVSRLNAGNVLEIITILYDSFTIVNVLTLHFFRYNTKLKKAFAKLRT